MYWLVFFLSVFTDDPKEKTVSLSGGWSAWSIISPLIGQLKEKWPILVGFPHEPFLKDIWAELQPTWFFLFLLEDRFFKKGVKYFLSLLF